MDFNVLIDYAVKLGPLGTLCLVIIFIFFYYLPKRDEKFEEILKNAQNLNALQAKEFNESRLKIASETNLQMAKMEAEHNLTLREFTLGLSKVEEAIRTQTLGILAALGQKKV